MDLSILVALLAAMIFIAVLGLGSAFLGLPSLKNRFQTESVQDQEASRKGWRSFLRKSERVVKPLGEMLPRSPEEMSRQERRLVRAGIRRKDGSLLLSGIKIVFILLFIVLLTAGKSMFSNPILCIALAVLFGTMLPDLWLTRRIATRTDRIQRALPNAMDLAVLCVEAGMGLDQAFMRIGEEMKSGSPELSDELHVLTLEINAGRKRVDALRNLANRSDCQDLRSLVAVLIQTDRFGTSVAQSLRIFAESMRTTRRLRAEEHAAKMSVKIIPALALFIFPAVLIVVVGPTIIAIMRELLPAVGGK
jgi:tight adherence protein C